MRHVFLLACVFFASRDVPSFEAEADLELLTFRVRLVDVPIDAEPSALAPLEWAPVADFTTIDRFELVVRDDVDTDGADTASHGAVVADVDPWAREWAAVALRRA